MNYVTTHYVRCITYLKLMILIIQIIYSQENKTVKIYFELENVA